MSRGCLLLTFFLLYLFSPFVGVCQQTTLEKIAPDKPQAASGEANPDEAAEPELNRVVKPFLWKIEGEKPSYLFGTIHVSDDRVLAMHPVAREAFENSDTLFVEVKPEDTLKQMKALILPFDVKLADLLDATTLARLDKQLEQMNPLYAGRHRPNYKIWAWPLILPNLEAQLKNPKMEVLDFKLTSDARAKGRYVGSLENATSQMDGLDALTKEEQIIFLQDSLEGMEEADDEDIDYEAKITNLYLKGDGEGIQAYFDEEMSDDDLPEGLADKILKALLYDRNKEMAETIKKALKDHPDKAHFFAAGTAHFVGPNSVQQYLKEAGIEAVRVEVDNAEPDNADNQSPAEEQTGR